jgi:hypothetical protein
MRPIFQVEGPKFLKGPKSRSFSYTTIAHTKVQKPITVKACLVSPRLWWLVQAAGIACQKLEKPGKFLSVSIQLGNGSTGSHTQKPRPVPVLALSTPPP